MIDINKLVRNNIKNLIPYSSAREEYRGKDGIFLDANENPIGSVIDKSLANGTDSWNRYPDPLHSQLKVKIAKLKSINPDQVFLGNGSDEAIDLLIRTFCEPGIDKIMTMPPTYGMYEVCASINNVQVTKVPLTPEFKIDIDNTLAAIEDIKIKLIYLCSPNNPTGNYLNADKIKNILNNFLGLVVIDEAYIDFCDKKSWLEDLNSFKNLVVLQTFSKVWGLANIRLGIACADNNIISFLDKIKYPYNVSGITQQLAFEALGRIKEKENIRNRILKEKNKLGKQLSQLEITKKVYPSDGNFFLVKFDNAKYIYQYLLKNNVIVRDRSNIIHCDNCLRITVGTSEENIKLIELLNKID